EGPRGRWPSASRGSAHPPRASAPSRPRGPGTCESEALPDLHAGAAKDLAGDDETVDLAGSLVNLGDPRVPEVALHRVLLRVPVTAVDLQSLRRDTLRHLGG